MSELAIYTENLTFDFGSIRAVDNLNLGIPKGSIFGFLGPNGAGKTTTINLLLGLLEPKDGHANVLGFDVRTQADDIRTQCGALLEHSGLYEQLSAVDNLEYYGRIWNLPSSERHVRIKELLVHMDLWERRTENVVKWSRGMQQKLAVARALMHRPSLVFLDEPTAGLDVQSAAAVRDDLQLLVEREGMTVFLTTHNMMEAEKLCSQIAVIRQGRLITTGHPDELKARSANPHVEIVGSGFSDNVLDLLRNREEITNVELGDNRVSIDLTEGSEVAPIIGVLVEAGCQVEEVNKDKANLEEVFLTLLEEEQ